MLCNREAPHTCLPTHTRTTTLIDGSPERLPSPPHTKTTGGGGEAGAAGERGHPGRPDPVRASRVWRPLTHRHTRVHGLTPHQNLYRHTDTQVDLRGQAAVSPPVPLPPPKLTSRLTTSHRQPKQHDAKQHRADDKTLSFYNVVAGGTIHMVLQLRGGR